MTAPLKPRELPFNARHYEDRLKGLAEQPRGSRGYHKGQTATLVKDLIGHVIRVQKDNALLVTKEQKATEALAMHADAGAAQRQPYEQHQGPPEVAIDAMVRGQLQAERTTGHANAEIARRLANADRTQREAQELLDRTKATAVAGPPLLELPPAPVSDPNSDSLADQAAWIEHIQACRHAVEQHREELAQWEDDRREALAREQAQLDAQQADLDRQEQVLDAKRDGVVANLDRIATEAPLLRERAIGAGAVPEEQVAS